MTRKAGQRVTANADRLVMLKVVEDIVGLKRTRIYRLIRESGFPAPYKPGGVGSRWSEAEVRAWVARIKEARAA
ncbi:AlpA family phage regulatory protein [Sphingomonas sp. 4RDLI-65]|uniref:helix-turn-helix transcriptional regulator n=1 Tax=Sphingomonas sp. 4RDLI-65 TaxID=3111641 RepID=UPI003C18529F